MAARDIRGDHMGKNVGMHLSACGWSIRACQPTAGRLVKLANSWPTGHSAGNQPIGDQSASFGPTRSSRPAAGRRCIIFENYFLGVIFVQINKKNVLFKKN